MHYWTKNFYCFFVCVFFIGKISMYLQGNEICLTLVSLS